MCANYLASGRKLKDARFSKFVNFEFRPESGWRARQIIEEHHCWESHRKALDAKDRSDTGAVARGAKMNKSDKSAVPSQPLASFTNCLVERLDELFAEDAALLKGNVPTAAEWKDGWAFLSEAGSLRKRRSHFR